MNNVLYSSTIVVLIMLISSSLNFGLIGNNMIVSEMFSDVSDALENEQVFHQMLDEESREYLPPEEPTLWSDAVYVNNDTEIDSDYLRSEQPTMVIDAYDTIHMVWVEETNYQGSGTDKDIFYQCKPADEEWGACETEVVSLESSSTSQNPTLAVDDEGAVHVVWSDDTSDLLGSGADADIFYKQKPREGSWGQLELVSFESSGNSIQPSLVIDHRDTIYVAWAEEYNGIFTTNKPQGGLWESIELVENPDNGELVYNPSIYVDDDKDVHISWEQNNPFDDHSRDIYYRMKEYEEQTSLYVATECQGESKVYVPYEEVDEHVVFRYQNICYEVDVTHEQVEDGYPIVHLNEVEHFTDCEECEETETMCFYKASECFTENSYCYVPCEEVDNNGGSAVFHYDNRCYEVDNEGQQYQDGSPIVYLESTFDDCVECFTNQDGTPADICPDWDVPPCPETVDIYHDGVIVEWTEYQNNDRYDFHFEGRFYVTAIFLTVGYAASWEGAGIIHSAVFYALIHRNGEPILDQTLTYPDENLFLTVTHHCSRPYEIPYNKVYYDLHGIFFQGGTEWGLSIHLSYKDFNPVYENENCTKMGYYELYSGSSYEHVTNPGIMIVTPNSGRNGKTQSSNATNFTGHINNTIFTPCNCGKIDKPPKGRQSDWDGPAELVSTETENINNSFSPSMIVDQNNIVHICWVNGNPYDGTPEAIHYKSKHKDGEWPEGSEATQKINSETPLADMWSSIDAYGFINPSLILVDDVMYASWAGSELNNRNLLYCKQKHLEEPCWLNGSPAYTEIIASESHELSSSPSFAIDTQGLEHIIWSQHIPEYQQFSGARIYYKNKTRTSDMWSGQPNVIRPPKPGVSQDITDISPEEQETGFSQSQSDNGVGDALHFDSIIGNVYTVLPICPGFTLQYNSLNAPVDTVLGHGWTHTNNICLLDTYLDGKDPILIDGEGTTSIYRGDVTNGYITPPQRTADLEKNGENYILRYYDGSSILFNEEPAPSGYYLINTYEDRLGKKVVFNYNLTSGLLTSINLSETQSISLEYYEDTGHIKQVTHPNSAITTFEYNEDNDLTVITDPFGYQTTYEYDSLHNIFKETLKNGNSYTCSISNNFENKERILYDSKDVAIYSINCSEGFAHHRPATCRPADVNFTDGNNNTWSFKRNKYGQKLGSLLPDGNTTTYMYKPSGNGECMLIKYTNPRGYVEQYTYDQYNNNIWYTDDENSIVYYYDHPDCPALLTGRQRGYRHWILGYNEDGLLEYTRDPMNNVVHISYEYTNTEEFGRRVHSATSIDPMNNATTIVFDTIGRIMYQNISDSVDGPLVASTKYEYNVFTNNQGNPVTKIRTIQYRSLNGENQAKTPYVTDIYLDALNQLIEERIDPNDLCYRITYEYDGIGNPTLITNPKQVKTHIEYDHRGRQINITDDYNGPLERTTQFQYDTNNNIKYIIDPKGNTTTFYYNEMNRKEATRDAENYITEYLYTANGDVKDIAQGLTPGYDPMFYIVDEGSAKTSYMYDSRDWLTRTCADPDFIDHDRAFTWVEYYSFGGFTGTDTPLPGKITDGENHVTYMYYNFNEQLTKKVHKINDVENNGGDEDDAIYEYFYDEKGRLIRTEGPEGEVTLISYDAADRIIKEVIDPDNEHLVTQYEWDGVDLCTITQPNGNVITTVYDGAGRPVEQYDSVGLISTIAYDELGNVISTKDGLGREHRYYYDTLGRQIITKDPMNKLTFYTYDKNDNLVETKDAEGTRTHFYLDKLGRILVETHNYHHWNEQGADDTGNTDIIRHYNGLDQLISITDETGVTTHYFYDTLGGVKEILYPGAHGGQGHSIVYTYYENGPVHTKTDQNGYTTTYYYSDLDQLQIENFPITPTQPAYQNKFFYDRSGRMTNANNPYALYDFDYDSLGRLIEQKQKNMYEDQQGYPRYTPWFITTKDYVIGPTSIINITYPGDEGEATEVSYQYDLRNRLMDISSEHASAHMDHNIADELVHTLFGDDAFIKTIDYDDLGRIENLIYQHDQTTLIDEEYGYDAVGNRLYTLRNHDPDTSELYFYDGLYRLIELQRGVLNQQNNGMESFTESSLLRQWQTWNLDPNGNWLSTKVKYADSPEELTQYRTPNPLNQYTAISDWE